MSAWLLHLSPDAALVLLTIGIFLVYLELNRPGSIFPGALGLTVFLLAVARLWHAQLNYSSIVLILAAIAVFSRSLRRPTPVYFYVLATICLLIGFLRLIPAPRTPQIHPYVAAPCALLLGISTTILARIARRARRNKGLD